MSNKKSRLTAKQIRGAELLASGWLSKHIAQELKVSPETISHWKHNEAFQVISNHFRAEVLHRSLDRLRALHIVAFDTLSNTLQNPDTPQNIKLKAALGIIAAGGLTDKGSMLWDVTAEDRKTNLHRDAEHELALQSLVKELGDQAYSAQMERLTAIGMGDD